MKQRLNFLDGIRGWGAVTVLFYHVFVNVFPITDGMISPAILARFFVLNGTLAVWIFFIVSGFAISHNFFSEQGSNQLRRLFFSRYPRFALPILIISLIVVFGTSLNLIPEVADRPEALRQIFLKPVSILDGIRFALYDVFFAYDGTTSLVPPLWTMHFELMGSLTILTVLPFLKKPILRYIAYCIAISFCYYYNMMYVAFVLGVMFADLYASQFRFSFKYLINITVAILILPILYLSTLLPTGSSNLYLFIATSLAFVFIFNDNCQAIFANSISTFLGRISFSLYLVHAPILILVGMKLHAYPHHFWVNVLLIALSFIAAGLFQKIDRVSQRIANQFSAIVSKPLTIIAARPINYAKKLQAQA